MFNKNRFKKLIFMSLILSLIMGFGELVIPKIANAADYTVQITGNGVNNPVTLTRTQLEEMTQVQVHYSTNNTWPAKKWYVGEGVPLADIFSAAGGIKAEAKLIKVYGADGYKISFTRWELLDDTRYYYPGLKQNHEYNGEIAGSTAGAITVGPILALKSANSDNFDDLSLSGAPHILFGQRYITEQTSNSFVKWVCKIEVLTTTPEAWAEPTASIPSGTVAKGTEVELSSAINGVDKIHYTIDGTTPTIKSPIYNWIDYRWWTYRAYDLANINSSIIINANTTIKALVIGPGLDDSQIETFTYDVLLDSPSLTLDTTNNAVGQVVDITFTDNASWRSVITDVTVNGNSIAGHYTVTEGNINIDSSVFATANTYAVVVAATGYTNASVNQTIVLGTPPSLEADTSMNRCNKDTEITFEDNGAWRGAIVDVRVNGNSVAGHYTVTGGKIIIAANTIITPGTYPVVVTATGYNNASVNQAWK